MERIKIEKAVRNPKAAALCSLFLLLPVYGLTLCTVGSFHDPSSFRELWPVVVVIVLACIWILFIVLSGCCFLAHGKYVIEYDKKVLRVTAHGPLRKSCSEFPWSDVLKVGFLASPRVISRGSLFVEMPRNLFRFGDELKYEEQIELAKRLHEAHEQMKRQ